MTVRWPDIAIGAVGIEEKQPYLAHSRGDWGPENDGTLHPLTKTGHWWVFKNPDKVLAEGEQFKILVKDVSPEEARGIHDARVRGGVHVGGPRTDNPLENFDYDPNTRCMWFLAHDDPDSVGGGYPSIRVGKWNRNSVFARVLPESGD